MFHSILGQLINLLKIAIIFFLTVIYGASCKILKRIDLLILRSNKTGSRLHFISKIDSPIKIKYETLKEQMARLSLDLIGLIYSMLTKPQKKTILAHINGNV